MSLENPLQTFDIARLAFDSFGPPPFATKMQMVCGEKSKPASETGKKQRTFAPISLVK